MGLKNNAHTIEFEDNTQKYLDFSGFQEQFKGLEFERNRKLWLRYVCIIQMESDKLITHDS